MIDRHAKLAEFVEAVSDMRIHQRTFFRSPAGSAARQGALHAAQLAERRVDMLLAEITSPQESMPL